MERKPEERSGLESKYRKDTKEEGFSTAPSGADASGQGTENKNWISIMEVSLRGTGLV